MDPEIASPQKSLDNPFTPGPSAMTQHQHRVRTNCSPLASRRLPGWSEPAPAAGITPELLSTRSRWRAPTPIPSCCGISGRGAHGSPQTSASRSSSAPRPPGVPLAASISLTAELPFAFVRKPGYRGHEIDEPPVRGADVAGRRVLLVDDAISTGTSVERFSASLVGVGAEVVGVFVLVDMRDVAATVSPVAAALATDAVSTYLQVLDLATANGLLDAALHKLTVDAIVNRWTDDDPRWDLLPVTDDGPLDSPVTGGLPVCRCEPAPGHGDFSRMIGPPVRQPGSSRARPRHGVSTVRGRRPHQSTEVQHALNLRSSR